MTIIACSSTEMLMIGDTLVMSDGFKCYHTTKIVRGADGSVGGAAGDSGACAMFLQWVKSGCAGAPPAEIWKNDKDANAGLLLRPDGSILVFECVVPDLVLDKATAIGVGEQLCMAALRAGATLRRAVEIACELNGNCGGELQELSPTTPTPRRRSRRCTR